MNRPELIDDTPDDRLDELIDRADLDELIRLIDTRTSTRDWAGLRRTRDRARSALRTGRQLWPVATLAEYRLALWAPADWAAGVLGEESGRWTIGPLTEVVAQRHTWAELAPHLEAGPRAALIAHERSLRGDTIDPDDPLLADSPDPLELPMAVAPWEPDYALATYGDEGLDQPSPPLPAPHRFRVISLPSDAVLVEDAEVEIALRQLVEPWTATSNGRAECVAVEGDHAAALWAAGAAAELCRVAELTPAEAMAWMAWAGATGGANGRRRGAAVGRFGAWWLLAALTGLTDDWPLDPAEAETAASELRWFWWSAGEPVTGWQLQLVVHDPADDLSWSLTAQDA